MFYDKNLLPPLLFNLFVTIAKFTVNGTRTASNYRTLVYCTNFKQFTILYEGPEIWHSLPVSDSRSSNLLSFMTKIQDF